MGLPAFEDHDARHIAEPARADANAILEARFPTSRGLIQNLFSPDGVVVCNGFGRGQKVPVPRHRVLCARECVLADHGYELS